MFTLKNLAYWAVGIYFALTLARFENKEISRDQRDGGRLWSYADQNKKSSDELILVQVCVFYHLNSL